MTSGLINLATSPTGWAQGSFVRHLKDPFSDAALAEPVKKYVDVGEVRIGRSRTHFPQVYPGGHEIKKPGHDIQFPPDEPGELLDMHGLFIAYAKKLVGRATYLSSSLDFVHHVEDLEPGHDHRISTPHLDGVTHKPHGKVIRLVGIAVNVLPPVILQGSIHKNELVDNDLCYHPDNEHRFQKELLPIFRLILVSPATLHAGQLAPTYIPNRHFLRYQLFV
jgi:hypothetical protein